VAGQARRRHCSTGVRDGALRFTITIALILTLTLNPYADPRPQSQCKPNLNHQGYGQGCLTATTCPLTQAISIDTTSSSHLLLLLKDHLDC